MQARNKKGRIAAIGLLFAVQVVLMFTGCQSGHKTADTGPVCPACQAKLRAVPIAELTYTVGMCPECKKVLALDAATPDAVEAYLGAPVGDTVDVCDGCQAIVERCAVCREP
jgi:hypothetical protein